MNKARRRSISLLLISFCICRQAWCTRPTCSQIGELVHLGQLTDTTIDFLDVLGSPAVLKSQINSSKCKRAKATLTKKDYRTLQVRAADGEKVFVILRQLADETPTTFCVLTVLSLEELSKAKISLTRDGCTKSRSLVKMKMHGKTLNSTAYLNSAQVTAIREFLPVIK